MLVALTAMVALCGVTMVIGLAPLRRGDLQRAVLWWAGANWGIAVVAAATATFSWPLMMLAALLPAVLATGTEQGRRLVAYVAVSVVVCTTVVLAGELQDVTGLSEATPAWIRRTLLALFTPALAAMVGLVVLQNSLRLQAALSGALDAQRELGEQADELRRSRARVVAAADRERRTIERDLHDGAQQRLISIGIALSAVRSRCHTDPDAAMRELEDLRDQVHIAHNEVRDLAQGLYPPVLSEHGLAEALRSAVDRYPLRITLDLRDPGRHLPELEAAVYFCCLEALQNAAKHSSAEHVLVSLGAGDGTVWFQVLDDGQGFVADQTSGTGGMLSMRDRLGASGGGLDISSAPGRGTLVRGHVPVDVG
ncbi:sensor histidine kinase [Nocardioides humi]|uniref:sensor histidine kinase n=1 Tax=Nocardioides humi TaxID=449461 RepID=UPI0015E85AB3|nr:histidine kinase [Nocardioides humi]